MSAATIAATPIALAHSPSLPSATATPDRSSPTFFLDLDQCALYGEDFNDLVTLAQATNQTHSSIKSLLFKLINPAMVRAMRALIAKHPNARVCLYTKKGGFITQRGVPNSALKAGEAYFPSHTTVDEVLACKDPAIPCGLIRPYIRLFLAREVIQEMLGLPSPPELIITAVRKSVQRACLSLLKPPANPCHAFLWDDNAEIATDFHVIPVAKFNAIPRAAAELADMELDAMFEDRKLHERKDADTITFLRGNLRREHSCYDSLRNRVFLRTGDDPASWTLPELVDDRAFAMFIMIACSRRLRAALDYSKSE